MAGLNGFVKLHRKMIEWGWYSDSVVKCVFLHILMVATFKPCHYQGYELKPGQAIIGRKQMATTLGFSEQQIRTALKKLESTGEITLFSTNKFTIATVENWEFYQGDDGESNQQITNEQPTDNQQITNNQPHLKNVKNVKNVKNINIYQLIVDIYSEKCVSYPAVRALSEARKKAISARLKTYSVEDFTLLFEKAEASDFLKGKNDRNWSANFDWLIKDANMAKVLDGNYDNKKPATPAIDESMDDLDEYF